MCVVQGSLQPGICTFVVVVMVLVESEWSRWRRNGGEVTGDSPLRSARKIIILGKVTNVNSAPCNFPLLVHGGRPECLFSIYSGITLRSAAAAAAAAALGQPPAIGHISGVIGQSSLALTPPVKSMQAA